MPSTWPISSGHQIKERASTMLISEEMEQQTMVSILMEVKWELEEPHKIKA